jgi:hypothetical protein
MEYLDLVNSFVNDSVGTLNSEVINFVDYKSQYYDINVFKSKFGKYLLQDETVHIIIKNFMIHYEIWNYYMIKELFEILLEMKLVK